MAKERKLTAKEQKRLDEFNQLALRMENQGYQKKVLTINIIRANVFAFFLLIPLGVIGFVPMIALHHGVNFTANPLMYPLFLAVLVILVVVHEIIHGISWGIFAENHFKDIEFGFMVNTLTPYCACKVPLSKGQYLFGTIMPFIVLGVIPMIWAVINGSFLLMMTGIFMADSAAGDLMVIWKLLRYRSDAEELVCIDHPTEAGVAVFER